MIYYSVNKNQTGFTLIELVLVMVIVGIMLAGGLRAYSQHQLQLKRAETKLLLHRVEQALWGYLGSRHHFPCPDTDFPPDGRENRNVNSCVVSQGALPYLDLQITPNDAWGNPLFYAISPSATNQIAMENCNDGSQAVICTAAQNQHYTAAYFSNISTNNFDLHTAVAHGATQPTNTTNDLTITALNPFTGTLHTVASEIPIVVISFGKNGRRNWQKIGLKCPADLATNERNNCDGDSSFVQLPFTDINTATELSYFDDMLLWLSPYIIKAKALETKVIVP